jgi:hypothetical protein
LIYLRKDYAAAFLVFSKELSAAAHPAENPADDVYNKQLIYLSRVHYAQSQFRAMVHLAFDYIDCAMKYEIFKAKTIVDGSRDYFEKHKEMLYDPNEVPELEGIVNIERMVDDYFNLNSIFTAGDTVRMRGYAPLAESFSMENLKSFFMQMSDLQHSELKSLVIKESLVHRLIENTEGLQQIPALLVMTIDRNLLVIENPQTVKPATLAISSRNIKARVAQDILEVQEERPAISRYRFKFATFEEALTFPPII